uniref:RRM domain-containing protein n=1 Tax=Loa loa TaxID=7209 RepID=A0A1I7VJ09_LOALO
MKVCKLAVAVDGERKAALATAFGDAIPEEPNDGTHDTKTNHIKYILKYEFLIKLKLIFQRIKFLKYLLPEAEETEATLAATAALAVQQLVAQRDVQLEQQRQLDAVMSNHNYMDNAVSVRHGHDAYRVKLLITFITCDDEAADDELKCFFDDVTMIKYNNANVKIIQ